MPTTTGQRCSHACNAMPSRWTTPLSVPSVTNTAPCLAAVTTTDLSTGNNFAARSVSMSFVVPKTEITVRPRGKPRARGRMSASGWDSRLTVGPPALGMPRTITP